MSKLLKSNFVRLRKSPVFWLALVAATVNPLYTVLNNYYYGKLWEHHFPPDSALMMAAGGYIFPIALAVFIALFIGTEYQDKTIRNKLIVGHTRTSLYLSNLITCVAAALTMYAAGLVAAVAAGIPLLGSYEATAKILLPQIGCTLLSVAALAAIYTLLAMLITNLMASGIFTLLVSVWLVYLPQVLWNRVCIPIEELRSTGAAYTIYNVLYDTLPTCQLYRYSPYSDEMPENLWIFPIYSMLIIAVTTVIGVLCFQKKNLK